MALHIGAALPGVSAGLPPATAATMRLGKFFSRYFGDLAKGYSEDSAGEGE